MYSLYEFLGTEHSSLLIFKTRKSAFGKFVTSCWAVTIPWKRSAWRELRCADWSGDKNVWTTYLQVAGYYWGHFWPVLLEPCASSILNWIFLLQTIFYMTIYPAKKCISSVARFAFLSLICFVSEEGSNYLGRSAQMPSRGGSAFKPISVE